jgi:hypothetical protein
MPSGRPFRGGNGELNGMLQRERLCGQQKAVAVKMFNMNNMREILTRANAPSEGNIALCVNSH